MLVRQGEISEIIVLSNQIPELHNPHQAAEYKRRLYNVPHLILVAEIGGQLAGFKVGYERDGYWYSWMGGVHPDFRRRGLARKLAEVQEAWATKHKYPHVTFKTRNSHAAMLQFALGRGFQIIELEKRPQLADYRILLRKPL